MTQRLKRLPLMRETWVRSLGQEDPLEKEMATHFSILASFVKNKVPISAWVYFWAFYLVALVYISVFVPVSYCLDDCSFVL